METSTATQTLDPYTLRRVRLARVDVVGRIWMPDVVGATSYSLSDYDLSNIAEFTRDGVRDWLDTHAGDFQHVSDFLAVCGDLEIDWADEKSELTFWDCMYGGEE